MQCGVCLVILGHTQFSVHLSGNIVQHKLAIKSGITFLVGVGIDFDGVQRVGGLCCHSAEEKCFKVAAGDAGSLEITFFSIDGLSNVVKGESGGAGGLGGGRHFYILSGSLALAVGRNPNFYFDEVLFFVFPHLLWLCYRIVSVPKIRSEKILSNLFYIFHLVF